MSLVALAVAATICFVFAPQVISFLIQFYQDATFKGQKLVFTGPLDAFATRLKIATYGGIVLASPVWLWELWRLRASSESRRSGRRSRGNPAHALRERL